MSEASAGESQSADPLAVEGGLPAWSWQPATGEHFPELDAPWAGITPEWAWGGSTGAGVKVAVVDSGVDAAHPAVGGVAGSAAIRRHGSDLVVVEGPHDDPLGHGTACAGIIRQQAPGVELFSVQVIGPATGSSGLALLTGLRWALEQGVQVLNLSLSTRKRDFYAGLHEVADAAYWRNAVIVAAANNLPVESYPWHFASVVSVGSHALGDPDLHFYNPGRPAEFTAHGVNVSVPWIGGASVTSTGNSFAAPHITALIARILARHPTLTPFQLKHVLYLTAGNVRGKAASS